jgi:hypothetical protein
MSWTEFTNKRRPPSNKRGGRKSDEKVDVREWADFFGLDPKELK